MVTFKSDNTSDPSLTKCVDVYLCVSCDKDLKTYHIQWLMKGLVDDKNKGKNKVLILSKRECQPKRMRDYEFSIMSDPWILT